ncbi:MAG: hypothetical protein VW907_05870 [Opitutae bacterium]
MTKNDNPFGNFGGTTVGEAETAKWEYPGIGYNATSGILYVNEDQVSSLTLVPLAMRQCKEVEDANGIIHRYPVNMPKAKMAAGDDITYRLQVACVVDGDIYVFGARSWTARASWLNPRSGQYRDEKFPTGIWYALEDHIKEMKAKHGVATTPLCWELGLAVGEQITVGTGKNTSKSRPIVAGLPPKFVGPERVALFEALYQDEDLAGWQAEWKKVSTEAAAVEDAEVVTAEDLPEGLPF